jgi:hypothetical protein
MGIVPVDPSNNRDLFEGDRKTSGFEDKPSCVGFIKSEIQYIPTFAYITVLIMWSAVNRLIVVGRFFHQVPGFDTPQCGHLASSALISLLQLGQRIDFLFLLDTDYLRLP